MYKVALGFALFILAGFSIPLPIDNDSKVMMVAADNLTLSLAKIPAGQENNYGFKNREEFTVSSVAKPFRVITLNQDFFTDATPGDKNYLSMQNEWRVPVALKGNNCILLTVSQQGNDLAVVDLGGAMLAKELQISDIEPASTNQYILRIYPLTCDFLVKAADGKTLNEATYIPLTSAIMAIKELAVKKTFTLAEILPLIKQQIKVQPNY